MAWEDNTIIRGHAEVGNRWSVIAARLPGRTADATKNRWNASLKKCAPTSARDRPRDVRRLVFAPYPCTLTTEEVLGADV